VKKCRKLQNFQEVDVGAQLAKKVEKRGGCGDRRERRTLLETITYVGVGETREKEKEEDSIPPSLDVCHLGGWGFGGAGGEETRPTSDA